MFDLISIGDCVIDIFVPITEAEVEMSHKKRMLELRFGGKVPVGPSITFMGGNAANNAVGGARLGLNTGLYTNVGNDQDADGVKVRLKKEGVDTRYVVFHKNTASIHHIVLDYKGERTILVYHQPWKYSLPELDKSRWVYLTSLSPSYIDTNIIEQTVNYLERSGAKLFYQPGTFQLKQGRKKSARLLSMTEVLVLNLEEAKKFLGYDSVDIKIKKLLLELSDLGPRNVVITDGKEGSYGFDGQNFWRLETFPAHLVEMTGAGDAFATGVLAGLSHGESLEKAMRWGAANSASVVEHVGPQAGLLSKNKMQERLKEHSKVVAHSI